MNAGREKMWRSSRRFIVDTLAHLLGGLARQWKKKMYMRVLDALSWAEMPNAPEHMMPSFRTCAKTREKPSETLARIDNLRETKRSKADANMALLMIYWVDWEITYASLFIADTSAFVVCGLFHPLLLQIPQQIIKFFASFLYYSF